MRVEILGFQKVDFNDQQTGNRIQGTNIYYAQPIDPKLGSGNAYVKKFIPADKVDGALKLGQAEIDIQLSMSGKPFINKVKMV